MRAIILILILAVIAIIIGVASGFIDIGQTRAARAPDIDVTRNGVTATGGQTPAFEVETGSVGIGTREANVAVPVVQVRPPAAEAPAGGAQPAPPPAPAN